MNMTLINHTEFNAQKGRVFQTSHHRHALKIICVLCLYCLALQSSFAAEPVSATAQVNLAFNYQQAKNYPEAAKWYRKAAEQGNASAQLALAQLLKKRC